jgi:hypothetical protein
VRVIRAAAPALGILLLAALFFAPELFQGRIAATANMARWLPWAAEADSLTRAAPSHNPDCNLSYYPRRAILHQAWREGTIPLWNPYSFCGTPFLADVQAGVLYPVNWLLLPFAPGTQLGLFLFLQTAWGGLGLYLLLRRMRLGAGIAFGAGCAFALNGFFVKHFGQPTFLASASWTPWILWLGLELLRRPDLRRAGVLGLALALLFLAGQPQIALHAGYALVLVLLVAAWSERSEAGAPALRPGRVLATLCVAGVLAALLAGAQLLPTAELAARSSRAVLSYGTVLSGAFHPVDAARFVCPELFGTPLTGDEWSGLFPRGDGFYMRNQLNSVFAGTPIFLLALWGMTSARTRRRAAPFTALFVVSVLLAFGSPLARLAYEVLPGFKFARIDRLGQLVVLAQLVPAALAASELTRPGGAGRRFFGALVLLAAAGVFFAIPALAPELPRWLGADTARLPGGVLDAERAAFVVTRVRTAVLFAAGAGVAFLLPASRVAAALPLALAIVQLFLFAAPYRGDRPPDQVFRETAGIARLRGILDEGDAGGGRFLRFGRDAPTRSYALSNVLPPSTNVPFRLRDLQGYNALADRRLGEALESALGEDLFSHGIWSGRRIVAPQRPSSLEHSLLDILSVRAVVSGAPLVPIGAAGWISTPTPGFALARNTQALPRVRLGVPVGEISEEEMAARRKAGYLDRFGVEVPWTPPEGAPRRRPRPQPSAAGDDGQALATEPPNPETAEGGTTAGGVRGVVESWNEIVVRAETPVEAILVVADSYDPGWKATVDGEPAEILPAYGLIRGVALPPGSHEVRMVYRPGSLQRGVVLSLLGLVLSGAAIVARRRDSGGPEGNSPRAGGDES